MSVHDYHAVPINSSVVHLSFASGIIAHVTLYRHGEWDMRASAICASWLSAYVLLIFYFVQTSDDFVQSLSSFISAQRIVSAHLLGLSSSIVVYRLFFHRLDTFPGPIAAKITGWYHAYLYLRQGHLYQEIQQLHKRYGPIVRVAPAALSVTDPDAIPLLYAANSPCGKGAFYNFTLPRTPINFERTKSEHARRRKDWDHAFNTKALKSYEPTISRHLQKFLSYLEDNSGQPVNVPSRINLSIFELSAQLAFDKTFPAHDENNKQFFIKTIHDAASLLGLFAYVPWFIHLLLLVPGLGKASKRFATYIEQIIAERRSKNPEVRDVFSWMLEKYESAEIKTSKMANLLRADALTVILAATETTAAAITAALFYLAQSSAARAKLSKELSEMTYDASAPDHYQLVQAKYLNACINETLRLSPPSPSIGYYRQTPPEGLQLGSIHIPGNVSVIVPQYTMNHDPRFWNLPDEFIPERWTDRPELNKDPSVFIPFQTGPYGCVGKHLALMEMREYLAGIISLYNVALAPGQTEQKFYKSQKDTMVITYDDVRIVFTQRL